MSERNEFRPKRTVITEVDAKELEILWVGATRKSAYLWVGDKHHCFFHTTRASARQLRDWLTENLGEP